MTIFALLLTRCGLSQSDAAAFLGVRLDTVKSWSAGRRDAPAAAVEHLSALYRRIDDTAREIADRVETLARTGVAAEDRIVAVMTDADAQERGWPSAGAANAAVAIAWALSDCDFVVEPLDADAVDVERVH